MLGQRWVFQTKRLDHIIFGWRLIHLDDFLLNIIARTHTHREPEWTFFYLLEKASHANKQVFQTIFLLVQLVDVSSRLIWDVSSHLVDLCRILRVARAARIINSLPELRVLVKGMASLCCIWLETKSVYECVAHIHVYYIYICIRCK